MTTEHARERAASILVPYLHRLTATEAEQLNLGIAYVLAVESDEAYRQGVDTLTLGGMPVLASEI